MVFKHRNLHLTDMDTDMDTAMETIIMVTWRMIRKCSSKRQKKIDGIVNYLVNGEIRYTN